MPNPDVAEFIVAMFHARTAAHILHLTTGSFAEHKALNEFYDGIVPLADTLAENLQGKYGILEYPDLPYATPANGLVLMQQLHDYVDAKREAVAGGHTDIHNIIDEVVTLLSVTYYKLGCLK